MNPLFQIEKIYLLWIALGLLFIYASWKSTALISGAKLRIALSVLRFILIASLIIPVLNFGFLRKTINEKAAVWALMIDTSKSMSVKDEKNSERIKAALETAGYVKSIAPETEVFSFSGDIEELLSSEQLAKKDFIAGGGETAISKSLSNLLARYSSMKRKCRGVIVLSDGHETVSEPCDKMLMAAKAFDIKIYPVVYGQERSLYDLELDIHKTHITAFAGQKVKIPFKVKNSSGENISVTVDLEEKGTGARQSKKAQIKNSELADLFFEVSHEKQGYSEYTMTLNLADSGIRVKNKTQKVFVSTLKNKLNILMLEGYPFWDSKFIAQLLIGESRISLTSLNRVSKGKYFMVRSGLEGNSFIDEESASKEIFDQLNSFDIIVAGKGLEHFLDAGRAKQLKEYVRDSGKSVLFARGKPYSDTLPDIEEMEPVTWGELNKNRFFWRLAPSAIVSGFAGEVLPEANDPVWNELPPLEQVWECKKIKTFAEVLIDGCNGKNGESEQILPVLVFMRYGTGTVAVVNSEELWTWDFFPRMKNSSKFYKEFWVNLIDWLLRGSDFSLGAEYSLVSDRKAVMPGIPVFLKVTARKVPDKEAEILLEVSRDGKLVSSVKPSKVSNTQWTNNLLLNEPGDYKITLKDPARGKKAENENEIAVPLTVLSPPSEMDNTNPDKKFMETIAASSKGKVLASKDEIKEILAKNDAGEQSYDELSPQNWQSTWDKALLLLLIVALASSDYYLRRRNGLL